MTPAIIAVVVFIAVLIIVFRIGIEFGQGGIILAMLIDLILIILAIGFGAGFVSSKMIEPPKHPVTLKEAITTCGSPDKVATFSERGFTCKTPTP